MVERPCDVCGEVYEAKRTNSRYCSSTCRKRASRGAVAPVVVVPDPVPGPVEMATEQQLVTLKRGSSPLGQAALTLARRIDRGVEAGAGLASLVKQLEATLRSVSLEARQAAPSFLDQAIDEVAQRRAQRGA